MGAVGLLDPGPPRIDKSRSTVVFNRSMVVGFVTWDYPRVPAALIIHFCVYVHKNFPSFSKGSNDGIPSALRTVPPCNRTSPTEHNFFVVVDLDHLASVTVRAVSISGIGREDFVSLFPRGKMHVACMHLSYFSVTSCCYYSREFYVLKSLMQALVLGLSWVSLVLKLFCRCGPKRAKLTCQAELTLLGNSCQVNAHWPA